MNEFLRPSKLQHFKNVLYSTQLSIVLLIALLLNQSFLITNAAAVLSKREINISDEGFINVINATTENQILFNEKNVINITNKLNSPITTDQHDNKIPKELGSHEIEDQIETGSIERNLESPEKQIDASTSRSATVTTANRRIDEDVKPASTTSTISSNNSSISENTKDTSHTDVDHRLPLKNSINSTQTQPIENESIVNTLTSLPITIPTTSTTTTSPETTSSSAGPIITTTRTTLRIKSEDILELSTRNSIRTTESSSSTQTSTPRTVIPQAITTESLNSLTKPFKSKPNGRSELGSELNQALLQTTTNKTSSLNVQQFDNNYNNIKDEKHNNSESRANIQFEKNGEPVRNHTVAGESSPNPEIVTEKRAKYLVDHSLGPTLTTANPLREAWNSLKTVGEVNHNNVTFSKQNDPEDTLKKLADWAEIYQDNDDANHTLLPVPNTTQKEVRETTISLLNQDLKINSSRIDEIGNQDNHLTSEHITSTTHQSTKAKDTTERNIEANSTQKNAEIQQPNLDVKNVITSTTARNTATKVVSPKDFEHITVLATQTIFSEPHVLSSTTEKLEDTTLLDSTTTINTQSAPTVAVVTEKVNKSEAITVKTSPNTVHTTISPLPDTTTTVEEQHPETTTIFAEFFTTTTVLAETTTDTNDIPMLPTHRTPSHHNSNDKIIDFERPIEKDPENKHIPITTEKETIHISPTQSSTEANEPVHKATTLDPVQHHPNSTSSDIVPFYKVTTPKAPKDDDTGKIPTDNETTTAEVSPEIPDGIGDEYLRGDGPDYNTIIAISVSCIGLVALILLITFLIIMRKRQKQLTYGQRCRPVGLDAYSLDNISVYNSVRRKSVLRSSKRAYGNAAFDDPALKNNSLTVSQLATFVKKKIAIFDEFKDVPPVTARIDEVPAGCEDKNRYANIVPLPESRVHLKRIGDDEKTEYINANFVKGPKDTTHYYIACQAPLENTIVDFWRMIWEQNSRVIIMATDLTENGIEKCAEYLPPSFVIDNHVAFGDYQITLKNREVHDKYAVSMCHLKNLVTNTWREITHFWYQWPENGVPTEEASLIAMLLEARSYLKMVTAEQTNGDLQESSNNDLKTGNSNLDKNKSLQKAQGPLTIHCSPGTGRTGTVIACDIAVRALEQPSRSVDIPQIVYCVRRGRASAVQTREQYEFIYKVAHMYATKLTGPINDN